MDELLCIRTSKFEVWETDFYNIFNNSVFNRENKGKALLNCGRYGARAEKKTKEKSFLKGRILLNVIKQWVVIRSMQSQNVNNSLKLADMIN